jgi:uncharacterized protein YciI
MAVFAVTTAKGPNWDHGRAIREQQGWDEHAIFANELVDRGLIVLGGPIGGGSDEELALLAVVAADEQELRSIFSRDPWMANGVFRVKEVRPWTIWLDGTGAVTGQRR